ncbi:protein of unknown function [Agreia sp. COWG]|nr:protein of unknown function [Agreia sp. COWG]
MSPLCGAGPLDTRRPLTRRSSLARDAPDTRVVNGSKRERGGVSRTVGSTCTASADYPAQRPGNRATWRFST